MNLELLSKPFPPEKIKQRKGPKGKMLSYVVTPSVIERLNTAFNGNWSFEVLEHKILEDEVVVLGRLSVDGIHKDQFGSKRHEENAQWGDELKAAISDSVKKCATMLGVALYLYEDSDEKKAKPQRRRRKKKKEIAESNEGEKINGKNEGKEEEDERKITEKQKEAILKIITSKRIREDEFLELIKEGTLEKSILCALESVEK